MIKKQISLIENILGNDIYKFYIDNLHYLYYKSDDNGTNIFSLNNDLKKTITNVNVYTDKKEIIKNNHSNNVKFIYSGEDCQLLNYIDAFQNVVYLRLTLGNISKVTNFNKTSDLQYLEILHIKYTCDTLNISQVVHHETTNKKYSFFMRNLPINLKTLIFDGHISFLFKYMDNLPSTLQNMIIIYNNTCKNRKINRLSNKIKIPYGCKVFHIRVSCNNHIACNHTETLLAIE